MVNILLSPFELLVKTSSINLNQINQIGVTMFAEVKIFVYDFLQNTLKILVLENCNLLSSGQFVINFLGVCYTELCCLSFYFFLYFFFVFLFLLAFLLCCLLVFIRFQFYLSFALHLGPSIKYVRSKGEGGGQAKTYVYCFYDVILLFKSVQVGRGCLKINRFDRTYFMDGPLRPSRITYQHNTLFLNSVNLWIT